MCVRLCVQNSSWVKNSLMHRFHWCNELFISLFSSSGLRFAVKEKWKLCLTTKYLLLHTEKEKCEKILTGENASTTYYRPTIKINMLYWCFLSHAIDLGAFVLAFFPSPLFYYCFFIMLLKRKNGHYAICSIAFLLIKLCYEKIVGFSKYAWSKYKKSNI